MAHFERLGSALERLDRASAGQVVEANLYVVVLEGTKPRQSSGAGSDHFVNLKVTDPLSDDSLGAVELMVFGREDKLPFVRPADMVQEGNVEIGDILRLTHVKLQRYRVKPQLMLTMKYESKKPNKNMLVFYQDPPGNQAYQPYYAYYNNYSMQQQDKQELDSIRQALLQLMQGVMPSANPFAVPNAGVRSSMQPGMYPGQNSGPAPSVNPGSSSNGPGSNGAGQALPAAGRPGLPLHVLPNGAPPAPSFGRHMHPPLHPPLHVLPPSGSAGAASHAAATLPKPPTAVYGVLPALGDNPVAANAAPASGGATAAPAGRLGASAAGPSNTAGPVSGSMQQQQATILTRSGQAALAADNAAQVDVVHGNAGQEDAAIIYPKATGSPALLKLSGIPQHCHKQPLQLVDLLAQVVARDDRFIASHGVSVLYLWDGTDMPLLQRRFNMLPALPFASPTLPRSLPRLRFAMPLASMASTTEQGTGEASGTLVAEPLPNIGSALPLIVPAAAKDSVPAVPSSASWWKLRKLSIRVHQGQVQAVWLPASKCVAIDNAKGEVAGMAAARLTAGTCTCNLLPEDRAQLATRSCNAAPVVITATKGVTPLVTLRQVLSQRPTEPIRVLACITGHHPHDLSHCVIDNQDDMMPKLPTEECMGGQYCLMKVRLEDATGELDAMLVGAQAANFFAQLRLQPGAASLSTAMAHLEGALAGPQEHGSSPVERVSRKRAHGMDGPGVHKPAEHGDVADVMSAAHWGEFCLWPVCLSITGSGQPTYRLYHIVDTIMISS